MWVQYKFVNSQTSNTRPRDFFYCKKMVVSGWFLSNALFNTCFFHTSSSSAGRGVANGVTVLEEVSQMGWHFWERCPKWGDSSGSGVPNEVTVLGEVSQMRWQFWERCPKWGDSSGRGVQNEVTVLGEVSPRGWKFLNRVIKRITTPLNISSYILKPCSCHKQVCRE